MRQLTLRFFRCLLSRFTSCGYCHRATQVQDIRRCGFELETDSRMQGLLGTLEELRAFADGLYSKMQTTASLAPDRVDDVQRRIISQLERIFESHIDSLIRGENPLHIAIMTRRARATQSGRHDQEQPSLQPTPSLRFPGRNAQESWRFAIVLTIMGLIHEALVNKHIITKREIFYRNPELFSSQRVVDRIVDHLVLTFGVPRFLLNVVSCSHAAAAKGLVAGALKITRGTQPVINCSGNIEGTLITHLDEDDHIDCSRARWVLVVEKEKAIFRSLTSSPLWQIIRVEGVLITAKGYPDLATRSLLSHLSDCTIYCLCDYDPDGINIFQVYQQGCPSATRETIGWNLSSMNWIGLRINDVLRPDLWSSSGFLQLSLRDRRKACAMLKRQVIDSNGKDDIIMINLQTMLFLNMKAELEILEDLSLGFSGWVRGKLVIP